MKERIWLGVGVSLILLGIGLMAFGLVAGRFARGSELPKGTRGRWIKIYGTGWRRNGGTDMEHAFWWPDSLPRPDSVFVPEEREEKAETLWVPAYQVLNVSSGGDSMSDTACWHWEERWEPIIEWGSREICHDPDSMLWTWESYPETLYYELRRYKVFEPCKPKGR